MEIKEYFELEREIRSKHEEILNYIRNKFDNKKKFTQCMRGNDLNQEFYFIPFKYFGVKIYSGFCGGWGKSDNTGHFLITLEVGGEMTQKKEFNFNIDNVNLNEIEKEIYKYIDYLVE